MVHTKFVSRYLFLFAAVLLPARAILGQSMGYAIEHVTVINPGGGKPQPDRTIVVSGHTITTIVPSKDFKPTAFVRCHHARANACDPSFTALASSLHAGAHLLGYSAPRFRDAVAALGRRAVGGRADTDLQALGKG
jgi:hypothetical protein